MAKVYEVAPPSSFHSRNEKKNKEEVELGGGYSGERGEIGRIEKEWESPDSFIRLFEE